MPQYFAKTTLLPDGWADDVLITVDDAGWVTHVQQNHVSTNAEILDGVVIPGMPNLHSHAFQRSIAGKTEFATAERDSFWTWRNLMYEGLEILDADKLEDIAFNLYKEMLTAGYTHVGEFHYIHHKPDGSPYDDRGELSHRMVKAAKRAGIGITLLPVLYMFSGFGKKPPEEGQKRFINSADDYVQMIEDLHAVYKDDAQVNIGVAFHSLRAVSVDVINSVVEALKPLDPSMPFHIHIAEQVKEIDDCVGEYGKRPVEHLLEHVAVDQSWCFVHATHMTEEETVALAKSGAVAGVCPVTEANLGDGLFNLPHYIKAGGVWGVGSDSHVSVDMIEELRWLEYGQRLLRKERAVARTDEEPHVGTYLYRSALAGGAQVMGGCIGAIKVGCRADFLVVKSSSDTSQAVFLDTMIFTDQVKIEAVYVGGQRVSA